MFELFRGEVTVKSIAIDPFFEVSSEYSGTNNDLDGTLTGFAPREVTELTSVCLYPFLHHMQVYCSSFMSSVSSVSCG